MHTNISKKKVGKIIYRNNESKKKNEITGFRSQNIRYKRKI